MGQKKTKEQIIAVCGLDRTISALLIVVMVGLTVGCAPRVRVVEVEVTAAPQVSVVEVTPTPAPPPTFTVCASGCDFATIQAAIDDSGTGGGIKVEGEGAG